MTRFAAAAGVAMMLATGCSVLNGGDSSANAANVPDRGLEKSKITIGIINSAGSASSKLAERQGYFTEQGLEVNIKVYQAGTQIVPALQNGELDFGAVNYVTFFEGAANNALDAKIVVEQSQATSESFALLTRPNSPIRSPRDLIGKKVAIHQANSIFELLLKATLRDNDVDPGAVNLLPIKVSDTPAALETGQIDAGVVNEPAVTQAEQKFGAVPAFKIVEGSTKDMPIGGFIGMSTFVRENPKTVEAFQRAMVKAQIGMTNRDMVAEVVPDLTGLPKETVYLLNLDNAPTSVDATRLQRVVSLMTAYGGFTKQVDVSSLIVPTPAL